MKILTVFGTRPEAIKLAPVIHQLQATPGIQNVTCNTGQHTTMVDQVIQIFGLRLDYDLQLMQPNQTLPQLSQRVLEKFTPILKKEKPDYILVQGDTTTVFITSLAAFYEQIPVAHLEAGLRSGDLYSPWPEEANRALTSVLAKVHFAPTEPARENLLKENVPADTVLVTGNTVVDALLFTSKKIDMDSVLRQKLEQMLPPINPKKRTILVTLHRRESHSGGIENVCNALKELCRRPDVEIIFSVHPNPNVQKTVEETLGGLSAVKLIQPPHYEAFVYLMKHAYLILTDSGGIQEEAPSLEKPVLVAREKTERPEGIKAGCSILVGTETQNVLEMIQRFLDDKEYYTQFAKSKNPYGDGNASSRIAKFFAQS
ncbi:MAG: UDP-N-acetylglucosamine 2-epimerase (non-hydrolyzing) [Alphaproteobacteria bacterium]|jgi:UDP-N-acetylglucosamine 2-epimerase (non-hydrolysing)|nr:UDP-N-acetylglucosamine 2-epimerase (non-hydrolyzing) [Alphaproteobacteria bacterium]MBT5390576.1 UDP-N-acetylglucosamine 2-epimerase (non-hydrolyzing) [Alphaproteobacteria bacterium]MBT5654369.1 UDP-N-acetylglucosamine 2-epimerase (non-hydrolyzing) [Alphaproteobacteria bacterium]